MIRKHKKYNRPKKPFDTVRIKSENEIVNKYGLKNKKEIWKAKAKLDSIRKRAKELLRESSEEEQTLFLNKLTRLGYKVGEVVDVLSLTEEDVLNRRLQSVLLKKGIATTSKGARQLITHKHILIDGEVVNIPSYHVMTDEEAKIKKMGKVKKAKPIEKEEESSENVDNSKDDKLGERDISKDKEKDLGINRQGEKPLEASVNG